MPTREELLRKGATSITPQGAAGTSGTPQGALTREQLLQRGATPAGQQAGPAPLPTLDEISAQETGATFPSQEGGTVAGQLGRTLGNIPSSVFGVAKGALGLIDPRNIAANIKEIATGVPELVREAGGRKEAASVFGRALPGAAAQLLPRAVTEAAKAAQAGVTGNQEEFDAALQNLERELVNNPAELPLEILTAGRATAAKFGRVKQFDAVVSKAAAPITEPVSRAGQAVGRGVSRGTRGITAQATGLQPSTISQVLETPEQFTKQKQSAFSRQAVGEKVQVDFNKRLFELSDTGAAFRNFRQSGQTVDVNPNFIEKIISNTAKADIVDGKIKPTGESIIRDAKDIRAIQSLLDFWRPEFQKGALTANEFLNFRHDVTERLAKFERDIGKSGALESVGRRMRRSLNQKLRGKFEGLIELDAKFEPKKRDIERLGKDLFDREGNLRPASIDRIANLTTGTARKSELLSRVEELSPGSSQQIRILRAIEDIEKAAGIKVGTYARAAVIGGGLATSGVVGAMVAAILTSPDFAVPIIRQFGALRNKRMVRAVNSQLANQIKERPEEIPQPQPPAPTPQPGQPISAQPLLLPEGRPQPIQLPEAGILEREQAIREGRENIRTSNFGR